MNFDQYGLWQWISILIMFSFSYGAWSAGHLIGYGKHFIQILTITVPARMGWFIFEVPNLIAVFYYFKTYQINMNSPDTIAIILFTIHYINRDLIYPLRMSKFTKNMPIETVLAAMIYTTCNGYLQASSHIIDQSQQTANLRTILGIIVFGVGMVLNILCDNHLKSLKQSTKSNYSIPTYGLFKYVSSAHYLAEIIEWFGYFIVSGRVSALIFAMNTLIILSPRALQTHQWYKKQFSSYPHSRKSLIPFIY